MNEKATALVPLRRALDLKEGANLPVRESLGNSEVMPRGSATGSVRLGVSLRVTDDTLDFSGRRS